MAKESKSKSLYSRQAGVSGLWRQHLPTHVTSAQSPEVFRQRLKTFLFTRSYPNILFDLPSDILRGPCNS